MSVSVSNRVNVDTPSMKVPPKRKGNSSARPGCQKAWWPSMKVPPKRKGNSRKHADPLATPALNESPSEKEGKLRNHAESGNLASDPQ